jgi:hypothetical protein
MEEVLDFDTQPYDSRFPVVCFDESPYQLIEKCATPNRSNPARRRATIITISGMARLLYFCSSRPIRAGAMGK